MQKRFTPDASQTASLARRNFIAIAAGSSVAAVPALALADVSAKSHRLPHGELPLDKQLDICIANLRNVLTAMHPQAKPNMSYPSLRSKQDGGYEFHLQGKVSYQPYEGDGVYLISLDGWISECLISLDRESDLRGYTKGVDWYFCRFRTDDGGWDDFGKIILPNFIRKLGEVPTCEQ